MASLNVDGCLRVSLAAYNSHAEVDYFLNCLQEILKDQQETSMNGYLQTEKPSQIKPNLEEPSLNEIINLFSKIKGWDSRHREIMLLGKKLRRLNKRLRDEKTLIAGCESQAWLTMSKNEIGEYSFSADSDAKIIRGLLVIVLAAFNNKNTEEIHQVDIEYYFAQLGLMQHLSPSRGNGLLAIVDKIKSLAK